MEKQTNFDPAKFFDRDRASGYDQRIRKAIPGYEALHSMAATLFQLELKQDASVLIVGAGTVAEILTLSASSPQWQLTGVDPSAEMMAMPSEWYLKLVWAIVSSCILASPMNYLNQNFMMLQR